MERLVRYFTEGIEDKPVGSSVGMEVETSFVMEYLGGRPITVAQSQLLIDRFRSVKDWQVTKKKADLITEISDGANKLSYELGRQNLELSVAPDTNGSRAVLGATELVNELEEISTYVSDEDARYLWPIGGGHH